MIIALSAPFGLPGQPQLQAGFALGSVYFWSLFRPAAMPALIVFLLGLLLDLLTGAPIGVSSLTLLVTHAIALKLRFTLSRQGFLYVWLVFIAIAALASFLTYILVTALIWHIFSPTPALFGFLVAVGVYPVLATLLTRAHRGIAAPERA